jgi:hypothetical protein
LKRILLFLLLISIVSLSSIFSQSEGISFTIRYYDKKIYTTESDIFLKLMITNNSGDIFRFKIAENRVFNLDFDIRSLSNRVLTHSEKFIIDRNSNQAMFYREVSLLPGEEYAVIENLSNFIVIDQSGSYILTAVFYPNLFYTQTSDFVTSNRLNLSVRQAMGEMEEIKARIDESTGEILRRESLGPDKVVEYILKARQLEQWEKFFLYIDLESLLIRNRDREEKYKRLSEPDRLLMIEDFKNELKTRVVDTDIVVIPSEFEIIKTSYTPNSGTVQVLEKFRYSDYTEVKRYTYFLQKKDEIWYISNYDVRNIGTE